MHLMLWDALRLFVAISALRELSIVVKRKEDEHTLAKVEGLGPC